MRLPSTPQTPLLSLSQTNFAAVRRGAEAQTAFSFPTRDAARARRARDFDGAAGMSRASSPSKKACDGGTATGAPARALRNGASMPRAMAMAMGESAGSSSSSATSVVSESTSGSTSESTVVVGEDGAAVKVVNDEMTVADERTAKDRGRGTATETSAELADVSFAMESGRVPATSEMSATVTEGDKLADD
jgi:hypothetical protein